MNGTEFARISGSYSTAFIGTYQILNQSTTNNNTTFRLYGYFYYGGGTQVSSATNGGFYLDGTYIHSSHYTFNPGYHLLGTKDIVVSHNNDGTFPGKYVGISANSWHMSGSAGGNIYAGNIARQAHVTSATDFNDESNPTIKFTNPGGLRINARLEFAGSVIRRDNIANTGSYTFNLTNEERNLLRSKCPNSNTLAVREVIATCLSGTTENFWSWQDKTMTIVNANPTFNHFEFEDVNPITLALTGNYQNIIQGYSNVKAIIPAEFIAKANKSATMLKYSFVSGDKQKDITYKANQETSNIINNVKIGVFNVYAIDSRNNSTLVTKNANKTIAYNPVIKNNIIVSRENGISEITKLYVKGVVDLVNFGNVINSIKESKFRYKISSLSEWSDYKNIKLTVGENGEFSFNDFILGDTDEGFNIEHSYNIEVLIKDELSEVIFTANLTSGIPNIALHKNGVCIMGKYDVDEGGLLQIGGKRVSNMIGQIIRVHNSIEQTISSNATTMLNFDTVDFNNASSLTLKGNQIIIGEGISTILVNGRWTAWGSSYSKYVYIYKNDKSEAFHQASADTVETTVILPVEEGDIIDLRCYQTKNEVVTTAHSTTQTFLQVIVLN